MPLFGHYDDEPPIREAEVPPPSKGTGQRIRVGTVERDNGLTTATTSSVSNALYDLADQNSLTHTVVLPHGTTVKLAATNSPTQAGAWRSRFEITNGKLAKTVEAKGSSVAADLANQIDLLALAKIDKTALEKVTERHAAGDAEGVLVALGIRDEGLEEANIQVAGYVTKDGRHVGAYSQIRDIIDKLKEGQTAHFPEGISVHHSPDGGFRVKGGGSLNAEHKTGGPLQAVSNADTTTKLVVARSARSNHAKSLGGSERVHPSQFMPRDDKFLAGVNRRFSEANAARRAEHDAKVAARDKRTADQAHWHNADSVLSKMSAGDERTLPHGTKVTLTSNGADYTVNGKKMGAARSDAVNAAAASEKASAGNAAANIDRVKRELSGWSDRVLQREIDAVHAGSPETTELSRVLARESRRRQSRKAESRGLISRY